ncbi:MAG: HNH endonuclease family protein [Acidiferrobacterales bacterium]|nr:HNH endonuclease family protein [Acidiferrobacterales bacterium]
MWPFSEEIPPFDRSEWPHWKDLDRDGEDTRQEILARDSLIPVSRQDGKIKFGLWTCPYSGRVLTEAKRIDIDHVIALGEAHRMGGFQWTSEKKKSFANDFDNLLAAHGSSNRAKRDLDSFEGMPPNIALWARYLIVREQVVIKYELVQSAAELKAIKFYRSKWATHKNWIKMGRVRRFFSTWVPGMF